MKVTVTNQQIQEARLKKVFVVIPCHNHSRFILGAAQSVLNGLHRNVTLVCVEDGSTDEEKKAFYEQLENVNDSRLIVQSTKSQSGRWRAVNGCIEAFAPPGTHDYITVLDADDQWLPDRLDISLRSIVASGAAASLTGFHHCWHEHELEWISRGHQPVPAAEHTLELIPAAENHRLAKENYYRLRFGGGFPAVDFEPHSVSATFPANMWWEGYRFLPGNSGLRLSPGEDTCMALRLALAGENGLVIAKHKPYLYRRSTTTNQSDIRL